MSARVRRRYEFIGWITFVASAGFYLVSGLRAGDLLSTMGSVLFFVACIFFLAPLLRRPAP
jgi:hypothetical protein